VLLYSSICYSKQVKTRKPVRNRAFVDDPQQHRYSAFGSIYYSGNSLITSSRLRQNSQHSFHPKGICHRISNNLREDLMGGINIPNKCYSTVKKILELTRSSRRTVKKSSKNYSLPGTGRFQPKVNFMLRSGEIWGQLAPRREILCSMLQGLCWYASRDRSVLDNNIKIA
jgi:hypothetical protein